MKGFHLRSRLVFVIQLTFLFLCMTAGGQTESNLHPQNSNPIYPVLIIGLLALNGYLFWRMKKAKQQAAIPLSAHANESRDIQNNDDRIPGTHEKEWREIFQLFGQPTVLIDPDQSIVAANRAFERVSGLTEKELCGKKCFDVFHGLTGGSPPDRCPFEKIRRAEMPESFDTELDLFGGAHWLSCKPILDEQNQLKKVIHIATDILERRDFEKKLYSLSIKLETILTEIPDIVAEVNEKKVYT